VGVHESVEGEHTCKHKTAGEVLRFTLSLRHLMTRLPAEHHLVLQPGLAALTTWHSVKVPGPSRTCRAGRSAARRPRRRRLCRLCEKQGSMGHIRTSSKPWRANVPRACALPRIPGAAHRQAMGWLGLQLYEPIHILGRQNGCEGGDGL
jgi:hypothetical protein